jgi:hypothetical protein
MENSNLYNGLYLHLKGSLKLNPIASKYGSHIRRGLRILFWGNSERKATSCSFIKPIEIHNAQIVEAEIIIFSSQSIDKEIRIGESYSIGEPMMKIGEFILEKVIGEWSGKVP